MAAAQLAARPYGSFRFRNEFYATTTAASAEVTHLPASFHATAQIAARQPPTPHITATINRPAANPQSQHQPQHKYHHPPTSLLRSQLLQQPTSRERPAAGGQPHKVNHTSSAFIRNTNATASWDATRSSAYNASTTQPSSSSSSSSSSMRLTNHHTGQLSLRGSGRFNGGNAQLCTARRSSPSYSSAGTSVESIVPKYQQPTVNGSSCPQKRAYNQHKPPPRDNHHRSGGGVSLAASSKKQPLQAASSTNSTSSSSSLSTFSNKFPAGMPFEDEFYQPHHRSNSITSDASKYSSYSSYDNSTTNNNNVGGGSLRLANANCNRLRSQLMLPFEDEFMRKPSNELLYVDFSKQIPPHDDGDVAAASPAVASTVAPTLGSEDQHFFGCEQLLRQCRRGSGRQVAATAGTTATGKRLLLAQSPLKPQQRSAVKQPPVPPIRTCGIPKRDRPHLAAVGKDDPTIFVAIASWTPSQCAAHSLRPNIPAPVRTTNAAAAEACESLVSNRLKLYVSWAGGMFVIIQEQRIGQSIWAVILLRKRNITHK